MKAKLFFGVLLLLFTSCAKNSDAIEVIPNYNAVYAWKTDAEAKPVKTGMTDGFSRKIIKQLGEKAGTIGVYTLYIGESGKVDKIRIGPIVNLEGKEMFAENSEKFLKDVIQEIKDWEFEPAIKNGKPVKSKLLFELIRIRGNDSLKLHFRNPNQKGTAQTDTDVYFVAVEEMPEPVGGVKTVQKNVTYPDLARRAGIQGRVFVKTFIDEKGNVVKTEIIKGIGGGCDEAAQTAVEKAKFVPGKQRGVPVKTQVVMPILFQLGANVDFTLEKTEDGKFPDQVEIEGTAIETSNGTPIAAANIMLVGTSLGAATDFDGNFVITKIPPGKYKLNFNHSKYGGKKSKEFEFKKGKKYIFKIKVTQ